jgi:hypothetical protein
MKRLAIVVMMIMTLVTAIAVAGCSSTTKISDIQANPSQYVDKEVNIRGTVGETFWLAILDKGAYQIGDGTGTIWVVTTQPPPPKGLQVSTRGTVSILVKIGDQDLGTVITETKRSQ